MQSVTVLLLTLFLLVLLLCGFGEPRGRRAGQGKDRIRTGTAKRSASIKCLEYREAGEGYLDCQDRRLGSVPDSWPVPDAVNHLLLARNGIKVLTNRAFAGFPHLKTLDLQQNDISRIEPGAFKGLERLTTLLLQHNRLRLVSEEVFLPLPRLKYLRLYDNPWDCQCQLESLVRMLQVPSNRNLGNYAKCAEPQSLRGQMLKRVRPDLLCPELEENVVLDSQSPVRDPILPRQFPDATSLCHTYMFPRPLLDCTHLDLKNVPAELPSEIVRVDLSNNNIQHLRSRAFLTTKDMKLLNLSSNSLGQIDTAAFAGLLYLRELDLSNNSLHYFQYGVLEDLYFIRRLALEGNPWVCDYNIHYLVYWLKLHPGVEYSGLHCSSPPEFAGWTAQEYVKTYNGECPPESVPEENDTDSELQAQELTGETEELELPLLANSLAGPEKFEILRLS